MTAPTVESVWSDVSGRGIGDDLLQWVPDVFALTDTLLHRSEAYRFAVSPPTGSWPPDVPGWKDAVAWAAEDWCAWTVGGDAVLPGLVADAWRSVDDGAATALEDLASGDAWDLCQALLTLHAVSDEACAGMGVAVPTAPAGGTRLRGRANELLARTGSLARIGADRLRVLPKVRTPAGGISFRSLSRYVCVRDARVDVNWHRAPAHRHGTTDRPGNILLLPWPLRVRARDFRPLPGSVQRPEDEPFGFFAFAPVDELDVGLVDRLLAAARDDVGTVDMVVLPETSVPKASIGELEAVLRRHGVAVVVAGVREVAGGTGGLPANWVHLGVFLGGRWWRYRQNKHHRWFLDRNQIDQYHLGGALDPTIRWWEAMAVPRRSVQFIELGNGITVVAVVCEDLARLDEVADLLRAVGPTLVVTILLDGPQLAARWTARYASVLADDPGSAVLTLTSYGLVQRSRPVGRPPSSVVALWKDPVRGLREIDLDRGAEGVVVSVAVDRTRRRSADGRAPVDNVADLFVAGVQQVRAGDTPPAAAPEPPATATATTAAAAAAALQPPELTILASWSDAVAEAVAAAPGELDEALADAAPGAPWRAALGVPEPSPTLAVALARLGELARAAPAVVDAAGAVSGDDDLHALVATLISARPPARWSS